MSLFKKPNRNIRRRGIEVQDDDLEVKETDIVAKEADIIKPAEKDNRQNSKFNTKHVKQTLLSFGEELNEGDDGEVFQVKKSSQSRKLRRQIEREREERKKNESPKVDTVMDEKAKKKDNINTDEVTIKIINPIAGPGGPSERILTGFSAEMADYKSGSDEEGDERSLLARPKFTQPDHVKMLLKSGKIPDAALIHAARKRRQQAREMGTANFISLEEDTSKPEVESKSRLIREDDNDGSDEERISMSGIVSYAADREKRKEGLDAVIISDAEDEDHFEEDEWEVQQIRKAVSGAQLAAVHQESLYMQYMNNSAPNVSGLSPSMSSQISLKNNYSSTNVAAISMIENMSSVFTTLSANSNLESQDPEIIVKKLRERVDKLEEINKRRDFEFKSMSDEMTELEVDYDNRNVMVPGLIKRFQFYQDLRGYVTDLVECLDEKLPVIISLEERLVGMCQKKATELVNRRRQDVKDQMEDLIPAKNMFVMKRDDERIRRTAEREGRRIRRMKIRSIAAATSHVDGMSSDDEITEMTAANYRSQKQIIESDAVRVFDDVIEDFVSIEQILKRFSEWKKIDKTAYVEAYANMCLPKILDPIIRMDMLMWNPLSEKEHIHIDKLKWMENVIMYSAEKTDTEETLRQDPDLQLVPKIIEKTVIPKLEQIVKAQWDPLSITETRQLVAVIRKIIEYPFIAPTSKLFTQLINTVVERINIAIENDIFIPMLPKQSFDAGKSNVFFQRQFANTVKLFGNLVCWQGIINEDLLIEKANSSVLNRYLLLAIRTLPPIEAANKSHMIAAYMPDSWLKTQASSTTNLSQFFLYVKQLIIQIDYTNPHGREAVEKLTEIVKYVKN